MLRKIIKYFVIILLACALVFILFSCRAKKSADPDLNKPMPVAKSNHLNAAKFAHMYVDGCAERMKGNLQQALQLFEECEKLEPGNAAVHYEIGTVYKMLGNYEKAISSANISAASDPKNEWYQLLLIACYNSSRQYSQAIKIREALVKNFPARNEFKEDLAIDYAVSGQFDKSFKIYEELEKSFGVNEQLTMNKVKLLKGQKKNAEVEKELLKLSASNPKEPRFYAYLAEFYFEQNQPEKAKAIYDKIILVDPSNPSVHLALHDYFTSRGNDQEAFEHLIIAFRNPELDIITKAGITASFYSRAQKRSSDAQQKGKELAKIMIEVHPNSSEAKAIYADFLMLEKNIRAASVSYYKAAISETRDFRVWDNLLFTENELGLFDSLAKHSSRAMELFPSQPRNYLYNGVANTQLGNYEKAASSLTEGIEFVVDNKMLMLDFLRLTGDARNSLKQYAASDKAFDEALKIDPDNSYVLNNYAYYLSQRNENLEKAERLSKRTLDLHPGHRNYMDTYGWILFKAKKYDEAEKWLFKASSMGPANGTILEHLGDVYFKLGKTNEAVESWNAAKKAGSDSKELVLKIKNKKLDE